MHYLVGNGVHILCYTSRQSRFAKKIQRRAPFRLYVNAAFTRERLRQVPSITSPAPSAGLRVAVPHAPPCERVQAVLIHGVDGAKLEEHEVHEGSLRGDWTVHLSGLQQSGRTQAGEK